ncbi:MAG TPA: response regulator [Polyangiaceae bacterium]|nr:response regulator [Polyangiaceae bacterium]
MSRGHHLSDFAHAERWNGSVAPSEPTLAEISRLVEGPIASIVANIEFASSVLAGVADLASMDGGKASAVALGSVTQALAQAATSTTELRSLVRRLRDGESSKDGVRKTNGRPPARRESGVQARPGARPSQGGYGEHVPRILVVDDEVAVGRTIQRILRDRYDVTFESNSSTAAYQLLLGEDYDVIVCDVVMPTMSGIDLFKVVSAARRELAARFVFMSGGVHSPEALSFFEKGPNVLINKPFTTARVVAAIDSVLHLHAQGCGT